MTHEYKIVDPTVTESTEEKLDKLYIQIHALEKHHLVLDAIESPSEEETDEIEAIESQLTALIGEYEDLGGNFD
jgi:hypothetical protein|tara:strand:- start:8394 stop:8615 length:222 start_codon:yes stop_codon:yes gene_type:complete